MKKFYPQNRFQKSSSVFKAFLLKMNLAAIILLFMAPAVTAQQVFTVLEGSSEVDIIGVSPFAIDYRNQRSQYVYTSDLLQNQGAPVGYITAVALKITRVSSPSTVQPENVQIKMGLTSLLVLPENLIPNLPVHYSSAEENIVATGWYTFQLDTPMYWDGFSNIVIEFCRTNTNTGDSLQLEAYLGLEGEYRTVGLVSDVVTDNGCTLTGNNVVTLPNRRLLPSMQITMTDPCETNPFPGTVVVSEGNNYCNEPFTLSVIDDSLASGLSYQWQYSIEDGTNYTDIPGAVANTLTTSQEFATYYRRGAMCDVLGVMLYSPGLLVAGPDCYCNPTVTTVDAAGITNVTFDQINSTSTSAPSYTDFRNLSTLVQRVGIFPLTARVTATTAPMFTKAWIDWNQDGNFSAFESYELGMVNSGVDVSSGMTASVIVPTDALLGETVMRVRSASVANMEALLPCGNTPNGESEDYTIIVAEELGIQDSTILKSSIIVYGYNQAVNIRSTIEDIKSVKIYDISGRLLFTKADLNDKQTSIALPAISSQILIVEIKTMSGFVLNRKVTLR